MENTMSQDNQEPHNEESAALNQEYVLGWYGHPIAKMHYNGMELAFDYEDGWLIPLESYNRQIGQYPMFLRSFLPSSIADRNVDSEVAQAMSIYFSKQERFMANVVVAKTADRVRELGAENLHGRLAAFNSAEDVFTGGHENVILMTRKMMADINGLIINKRLTQISGNQTKVPVFLDTSGELKIAQDLPATHIIKYAGFQGDPDHIRGAAEWIGMSLIRAGGVSCADFSLIEMQGERGPTLNYLTERFDLPNDTEDPRMIFCEELSSALGMRPRASDVANLNDVIDGVNKISTNAAKDMDHLFRQVVSNCILENADFHIRNISIIKQASPNLLNFRTIRLSPAYDVMRTRDFAHRPIAPDEREPMRLNFLDENYDSIEFDNPTLEQFQTVGAAMNIDPERCRAIVHDIAKGMYEGAFRMERNLPDVFDRHEFAKEHVLETCDVVKRNALMLVPELKDEVDLTPRESGSKPPRP
jgi:hypothetical protein